MIYFVSLVTIVFLCRLGFGIRRLNTQPKFVQYYNHKTDMVEMILNMIVAVVGLSLLIGHSMNLI